jgi:hypothetical protein
MIFSRNQESMFQFPNEGNYLATIIGWKKGKQANTVMGLTDRVLITFELETGERVIQSMLVFTGPTSIVEKLFDSTIEEAEEEVHFDDLINKEVGVEVRHNHVQGKTYANIVDVFPLSELEGVENQDEGLDWPEGLEDL